MAPGVDPATVNWDLPQLGASVTKGPCSDTRRAWCGQHLDVGGCAQRRAKELAQPLLDVALNFTDAAAQLSERASGQAEASQQ